MCFRQKRAYHQLRAAQFHAIVLGLVVIISQMTNCERQHIRRHWWLHNVHNVAKNTIQILKIYDFVPHLYSSVIKRHITMHRFLFRNCLSLFGKGHLLTNRKLRPWKRYRDESLMIDHCLESWLVAMSVVLYLQHKKSL